MGTVLGVGLSHYPGPLVPAEHWVRFLSKNVERGRVPRELYEDVASWPEPMREEWGSDGGSAAAHRHRERLLAGYRALRAELDTFAPDLVLIWGDDQFENFKKDGIPAFCVYIFDELSCQPLLEGGRGPFGVDDNAWGLSPDTPLRVRGHREAANALTRNLLENDFDVGYAYEARTPKGLAHSFMNTIVYLDYDWQGFDYPVIPFHVNCYGNELLAAGAGQGQELSPPAPSPRRCFAIGRAIARFFAESPWRVALIASSSWSHGSLTRKHNRLYPDLPADRSRHHELEDGTFRTWDKLD